MESETLNTLAALEQDERYEHGPRDEAILAWALNPIQREKENHYDATLPWNGTTAGRVNVQDCVIHCLNIPLAQIKQADSREVARCLRHAGWRLVQDRSNGEHRGKRYWISPEPIRPKVMG